MTDDQVIQTIQTAIDDLASGLTAETNKALHNLTEWMVTALSERPSVAAPALGEIRLRVEPGGGAKRIERDKAGNIARIVEEP